MRDAVLGLEVVERRLARRAGDELVDLRSVAVGQEDRAGLRPQSDDVARPIVLFVASRSLVLADTVGVVLVDRENPGDPRLHVIPRA